MDKRKKNGGKRKGAGRKPIVKKLSNYEKAISLIDKNVVGALAVLVQGLADKNKMYRFRCAELILKKALPDKQKLDMEHSGEIKNNDTKLNLNDMSKTQVDKYLNTLEKYANKNNISNN